MKKVWSHAEDVTYMGPGGGFRVGWSEVLKDWESQAAMKLGGKVEAAELRGRLSEAGVGRENGPAALTLVSDLEIRKIKR